MREIACNPALKPMKISVDGLVIWEKKTGEADKVISILTPDGVITAYCYDTKLFPQLKKLGFKDEQVFTTMEMRMKCGIGKCGRCNIGDKFVCKDGPVFSFDQLGELPPEY